MNAALISEKAALIAGRQAAIKWLEEYGKGLTEGGDAATVTVHLNYASACPGSKEAAKVLSAYGRFSLPEIARAATECCRNDIAMLIDAIRKELATLDTDQN